MNGRSLSGVSLHMKHCISLITLKFQRENDHPEMIWLVDTEVVEPNSHHVFLKKSLSRHVSFPQKVT